MPYVKILRAQFQLLLVTTALKFAPMCFAGRSGGIKEAFTGLSLHSRGAKCATDEVQYPSAFGSGVFEGKSLRRI